MVINNIGKSVPVVDAQRPVSSLVEVYSQDANMNRAELN